MTQSLLASIPIKMNSTSKIVSHSKSKEDISRAIGISKKSSKNDYGINELITPHPNQDDLDISSMGEETRMRPVSTNLLNRELSLVQNTFDSASTENKVPRPRK